MVNEPRLTTQTLKVLGVMMTCDSGGLSGAEIGRATGLLSGTLYPLLLRFEQAGWLKSRWESETPQELGRPRRRLYEMTGMGIRKTKSAFREVTSAIGGWAWEGR
jgi:PadR family transcriptional regulator, regulatory protein PadR